MPRIVEDDLGLLAGGGVCAHLGGELVDRADGVGGVGMQQDAHVGVGVVPELTEHIGHAPRVVLGEVERRLPRSPHIAPDEEGVGVWARARRGSRSRRPLRVGDARRAREDDGQER